MLKQYYAAKEAHPGVIIAMRVGDFYEFYGEDAEAAARALEITLTGKEDGSNGRVAMAGVPHHSVEKYLARLLSQGIKVALCDQIEDPKTAKGLVRRAVTRVLTPGTVLEDSMLPSGANNFLSGVVHVDERVGLATLDPSTGEFLVTELGGEIALRQELARLRPAEVLAEQDFGPEHSTTLLDPPDMARAHAHLLKHFGVSHLQGFGCEDLPLAIRAASMVLGYATKNGLALNHVDSLSTYSVENFMALDASTRRSLELTQNLSDGSRKYSLLSILDMTMTSMGSRLMKRWIEQPLLEPSAIQSRHSAVARLIDNMLLRVEMQDSLKLVADLERLVSRTAAGVAGPRDLANLRSSLDALPKIVTPLRKIAVGRLAELARAMDEHGSLSQLLARSISPEPPMNLKDGGVILPEFDPELDQLRQLSRAGRDFIAQIEAKERARTGINTLKVGYNAVFGYYLEVNKQYQDRVPPEYVRKQTTAGAERYITAELKEQESAVLGASEKALIREAELFAEIRSQVAGHAPTLLATARAIAELDVLISFAEVSVRRAYVQPQIIEDNRIEITAGRHPVVEEGNPNFVPNDLAFADPGSGMRTMILTGPNMAGKSTYLRQIALIQLMAQIGSFVPAEKAVLGIADRIFARIGAKDELALGQSTFMVEMVECAYILNHATEKSLVVLDEVGRGTSTFDGMAIAWAIIEHLVEITSKTLFATHYHQLNVLSSQLQGVGNYRVSVKEVGDDIIWTHKVLEGGTDRSYGIHVARMAGLPGRVLGRAGEILSELESGTPAPKAPTARKQSLQLSLFEAPEPEVVSRLRELDVNQITPVEAIQILSDWKKRLN